MQVEDSLTKFGAGLLAGRIEKYWHDRDHGNVRVVRYALPGFDDVWGVCSNLVAGRPPVRKPKPAALGVFKL